MTEHETFPGKPYVVTSKAGCTITDASGELEETCEPGKQKVIHAPSEKLFTSAPAIVRETFKRAASVLRLLGGGVKSDLPTGYLRAEFLESNYFQKIEIEAPFGENVGLFCEYSTLNMHRDASPINARSVSLNDNIGERMYAPYVYFNKLYAGWNEWLYLGEVTGEILGVRGVSSLNWKNNRTAIIDFASNRIETALTQTLTQLNSQLWRLFSYSEKTDFIGRIYRARFSENEKMTRDFVPVLSENGKPCMFDKVRGEAYFNSGKNDFVAGFTLAQARKLGAHLPGTGGNLTISLPTGYEQDAAVTDSLETARAKGWTLTIQTYTPEAEAASSTFGMRRVWVRRTQAEHGAYVDAAGVRWSGDWCVDMLTPDGSTPDSHGYELYRSTEAAVAYWELSAWVAPEEEELLTTENL